MVNFEITKGGTRIFESSQDNAASAALLAGLAHGRDLQGCSVKCLRIGEAAAKVVALYGIQTVDAETVSTEGCESLAASGVDVLCRHVAPAGEYSTDAGERLIDAYSRRFATNAAFVEDIRLRLLMVLDRHTPVSDRALMEDPRTRLGSGGGGT